MTAGTIDLVMARAGVRIAVVSVDDSAAREELERLALLAGVDEVKITRTNGRLSMSFEGGGSIRFVGARHDPRGGAYDRVRVDPAALTEDLEERYKRALEGTGGEFVVTAPGPQKIQR